VSALTRATLSRDEARSLTDEVKLDAERLWRKLVELYDRGAHTALGYSSWAAYFEAEFGGGKSQAYRILDAGRVAAVLSDSPIRERLPANEAQARELAPLLGDPSAIADIWVELQDRYGDQLTAALARDAVERHRRQRKAEQQTAVKEREKDKAAASFAEWREAGAVVAWQEPPDTAIREPLRAEVLAREEEAQALEAQLKKARRRLFDARLALSAYGASLWRGTPHLAVIRNPGTRAVHPNGECYATELDPESGRPVVKYLGHREPSRPGFVCWGDEA
jgi:hypothetical protein